MDGIWYGFTDTFKATFFYTSDGGDTWEKSVSEIYDTYYIHRRR